MPFWALVMYHKLFLSLERAWERRHPACRDCGRFHGEEQAGCLRSQAKDPFEE